MKIPFSPSVYEHAARFVGRSPWEVSRDPELLFAGHRAAYLEYRHQPIVVGIDICNLEAEAYGARIAVPGDNGIPAIHEPLCQTLDEAQSLPPFDPRHDGRIARVIAVGQHLAQDLPEAHVRVPGAGPFSIAFNLRGITSLCEDVALRPDDVARWLMHLAENQAVFCRAVADAGLDVAFFESAASPPMLSPRQFHEVELPALQRIMEIAANCVGHPVDHGLSRLIGGMHSGDWPLPKQCQHGSLEVNPPLRNTALTYEQLLEPVPEGVYGPHESRRLDRGPLELRCPPLPWR